MTGENFVYGFKAAPSGRSRRRLGRLSQGNPRGGPHRTLRAGEKPAPIRAQAYGPPLVKSAAPFARDRVGHRRYRALEKN